MIQTDELRGIITKRNMSQASVAKAIGITPKTFYGKMKKGVFGSDEIDKMISLLKIQNPAEIFLRASNSNRYRVVVKSERRGENVPTKEHRSRACASGYDPQRAGRQFKCDRADIANVDWRYSRDSVQ